MAARRAKLNFKIWLVYPIFAPLRAYLFRDEILTNKPTTKHIPFNTCQVNEALNKCQIDLRQDRTKKVLPNTYLKRSVEFIATKWGLN